MSRRSPNIGGNDTFHFTARAACKQTELRATERLVVCRAVLHNVSSGRAGFWLLPPLVVIGPTPQALMTARWGVWTPLQKVGGPGDPHLDMCDDPAIKPCPHLGPCPGPSFQPHRLLFASIVNPP